VSDELDLGRKESRIRRWRLPRWAMQMAIFMRLVALAWFVKGVSWWTEIIGFDPAAAFEGRRAAAKAVAIGFGVIDLVAAVGLWLLSAWGGVIWLLAVTTEIVLTFVSPRIFAVPPSRVAVLVALILVYLALASLSASEEEDD
jgi:hypothetical protein